MKTLPPNAPRWLALENSQQPQGRTTGSFAHCLTSFLTPRGFVWQGGLKAHGGENSQSRSLAPGPRRCPVTAYSVDATGDERVVAIRMSIFCRIAALRP